jgi:hypothetical protein
MDADGHMAIYCSRYGGFIFESERFPEWHS